MFSIIGALNFEIIGLCVFDKVCFYKRNVARVQKMFFICTFNDPNLISITAKTSHLNVNKYHTMFQISV
jgi:hypothetical protein